MHNVQHEPGKGKPTMADPATIARRSPPHETERPRTPHTVHQRELTMVDGRKLLLDRRCIAFLCEAKPDEFGGKKVTIVAFKTMAKACPVTPEYSDLKAWWRADA
jgi:hypothetical protein